MKIIDEYMARSSGSGALAARALNAMPDGVSTDTRYFEPYGLYIERALGVRKWDVDGNEYRDFFGGHGAMMLGHSHPRVTRAIQEAAGRGVQFAASSPIELLWAELIQKHIPTAERVRFTGSGTEATLLAIRIARAHTGRRKIVRVRSHYHGWHDFAISGYSDHFDGSPAPGVLSEIAANTLLVDPNDTDGLQRTLELHHRDIAALMLEPLGSHFGIVPTGDSFLKAAVAMAVESDIPVILDEVISAFRVSPGGLQGLLDIKPDLTCLGKVAAGGLPGGAVCGSLRLMSALNRKGIHGAARPHQKVFHQGTFTGNPITANAAIATIDEVVSNNLCEHATHLGAVTRSGLNRLFRRMNIPWFAYGRFSSFHILPDAPSWMTEDSITEQWGTFTRRSPQLLQSLRMALNLHGVDISSRGTGFLSGVHRSEDVDCLLSAFESALIRLRQEGLVA